MSHRPSSLSFGVLTTALVAAALACSACAVAQQADPAATRRARLRDAGVAVQFAIFPVRVLGRADANVADVLGLALERAGMADVDVAAGPFDPGEAAWTDVPALFAAHVRAAGGARYGLYAEFLGDRRSGPTEVRFVVVDAAGEVVLVDRQTPADAAFRKTAARDPDPLGCSALVATRLFELAGWRETPGAVQNGRFAERWARKSGAPDAKEQVAMQQRLRALHSALGAATFAVLPPIGSADTDHGAADRLATALQQALECKAATAAAARPVVAPTSNQQKRLWDLARAAKKVLAESPIEADYAVAFDLGLGGPGKGFLDVVVLTRAGEVVLADCQNDQHAPFRRRAPQTTADLEALAVARLRQLLR